MTHNGHPLVEVVRGDFPVILSVPHSGRELPEEMKEHVSGSHPGDKDADLLAYKILEEGKLLGSSFSLVKALGKRSLLDLNWGESETRGIPVLEEYYWAYMNAIDSLLEEARKEHDKAILLDVHGYLESKHEGAREIGMTPGDIVFGTRHGRLVPREMHPAYRVFRASLHEVGFTVFPEDSFDEYGPFIGGDIVCRFGGEGSVAAIQMEVPNRIRTDIDARGKLARMVARGLMKFTES